MRKINWRIREASTFVPMFWAFFLIGGGAILFALLAFCVTPPDVVVSVVFLLVGIFFILFGVVVRKICIKKKYLI